MTSSRARDWILWDGPAPASAGSTVVLSGGRGFPPAGRGDPLPTIINALGRGRTWPSCRRFGDPLRPVERERPVAGCLTALRRDLPRGAEKPSPAPPPQHRPHRFRAGGKATAPRRTSTPGRPPYRQWMEEGTLVRDAALPSTTTSRSFPPGHGRRPEGIPRRPPAVGLRGRDGLPPREDPLPAQGGSAALMRATEANTSPIFGLYSDPGTGCEGAAGEAAGQPDFGHRRPRRDAPDVAGLRPASLADAVGKMADKKVFIADGHHRYETALAFRDEMSRTRRGRTRRTSTSSCSCATWTTRGS